MEEELTINKSLELKKQLEIDIHDLIISFSNETTLQVTDLEVEYTRVEDNIYVSVITEVRLPNYYK